MFDMRPRSDLPARAGRAHYKAKKRNQGIRGMPRLPEATKDVVSCEIPRGAANEL